MEYKDLSKQELIELVKAFEAKKKYGLIWENEKSREQFEFEHEKVFPIPNEIKEQRVLSSVSGKENYLIEGDNFYAINILRYTHQEKVDCIYIDPPYNTGNDDFKYNDKFVKKEDTFRHSQWLNFMSKRLILSRELLKSSGVLIVSIDDNELCQLKLLLDSIYGEDNFVALLPTIMNLKGNQDQFAFAGTHEYTLIYCKNKLVAAAEKRFNNLPQQIDSENSDWQEDEVGWWKKGAGLKMTGQNAPREKQPNLFFPVYVSPDGSQISIEKIADWDEVLPVTDGREMSWRWSKAKFISDGSDVIVVGTSPNWTLYKKQRPELGEMPSKKPKSVLYKPQYSSTNGASQIKNLFGDKVFEYAKPLDLIKDLLSITTKKDSIILDFFAGSGTTGHAVLQLNAEDSGDRKFILVTNNEGAICEEITYPRLKKVINGYTNSSGQTFVGLGGNLRYFKLAFLEKSHSSDEMKMRLGENCVDLLCFREGIFDEIDSSSDQFKMFQKDDCILGIYTSFDYSGLAEFKKRLDLFEGKRKAYIFSFDNEGLNPGDFMGWSDVDLEPIPKKMLEIIGDMNAG